LRLQVKISGGGRCNVTNGHHIEPMVCAFLPPSHILQILQIHGHGLSHVNFSDPLNPTNDVAALLSCN
jgi:hypothetical protein